MRIVILFCVFFILSNLKSQSLFNRSYHDVNEKTNSFVIEANGTIFHTSMNVEAGAYGTKYLYSHSNTGNLNFKQSLSLPSEPKLGFKSLDNKLVMLGGNIVCDFSNGTQTNYLAKYNLNGSAVFQTTYTVNNCQSLVACVQAADSSYYTFTDSLMIKISKSGQLNYKIYTGFGGISSALLLPGNQILVSAKSGSTCSFVTLALTGTVVTVVATPSLYTQMAFYGNQNIIARSMDGKFYKFSPALNLINLSSFPNGQTLKCFVNQNDSLHCILTSSISSSAYGVCDTSFNFYSNSTTLTQKVEHLAITLTSTNKVAIVSDCVAHASSNFGFSLSSIHKQSHLSVINKLATTNFNNDLAIVSVINDSAYSVCPSGPFGSPPCTVYLRAKVKVKNVGSSTINSFKLNCFEYPSVACGDYFYQQTFSQLNLNAGDTITVMTNTFIQKAYITPTSSITQVPYCFYVSVPNNELDKTLSDNELCKSFNFVTVGLGEIKKSEFDLKLYPNPFNTELKIESNEPILNYKIVDLLGKLVQEGDFESKRLHIKTEHLIQGIYFLNVETTNGIITEKIVKE